MHQEQSDSLPQEQSREKVCMIWMHGLGADSSDMQGLAKELCIPPAWIKHVFLDAPYRPITINQGMRMRAWYDIVEDQLMLREDEAGIQQAQQQISEAVQAQEAAGFSADEIILAGFSQGGAMALYTALHQTKHLRGVVLLSAYLPLASKACAKMPKETPIFMACGRLDPIVLPAWTQATQEWLNHQAYQHVSFHEYAMSHTVCHEEIADLSAWLLVKIEGVKS